MSTARQGRSGDSAEGIDEFLRPNYVIKRRRGFTIFMVVLVVVLVVLVVAAVIADFAVRAYAEGRAEKQIESSLPSGTTGKVGVSIHGFSVILQALDGRLSDVTLTSHDLVVSQIPIRFTADVADVPLSSGGTTGPVTATLTVDQDALNKTTVVKDVGGKLSLGRGDFSYDKTLTLLGIPLTAKVTATPSVAGAGKRLAFTPAKASLVTPAANIDASALLGYLKSNPVVVCTAKYLPPAAKVDKVIVTPGQVALDLSATELTLSSSTLSAKGTCS